MATFFYVGFFCLARRYQKKTCLMKQVFCDSTGARTQDPNIKSVMLYQLSYRIGRRSFEKRCKSMFPKCYIQAYFAIIFIKTS